MHLNSREVGQNVTGIFQLDPVILDVLTRGEVAVIAVIFARDVRQHVHLAAVERAIGNGDAQHVGVELQIEAVHQPQRLELVLGDFPRQASRDLAAKLGGPVGEEFPVEASISQTSVDGHRFYTVIMRDVTATVEEPLPTMIRREEK